MINLSEIKNAQSLVDLIFNKYAFESMTDNIYASMKDFLGQYLNANPAIFEGKKVLMLLPIYDKPNNAVEIVAVTHNDSHIVGQIRRMNNYNE